MGKGGSEPVEDTYDKVGRLGIRVIVAVVLCLSFIAWAITIVTGYLDPSKFDFDSLAIPIAGFALSGAIYEIDRSRRSDRLTATLEVVRKMGNLEFRKARDTLKHEEINWDIDTRITDDPQYEMKAEIRQLMSELNQTGFLVKRGLIDKWVVLDLYYRLIIGLWNRLEAFIEKVREKEKFPYYMKHFQYLKEESEKWAKKHD